MSTRSKLKTKLISAGVKYECSICHTNEWLGNKLSLHLDHINGINKDNRPENLRFLCPNCHSQTDTYCGKNNSKQHYNVKSLKVSDEQIIHAMDVSNNVKHLLEGLGLAGALNYQRVYRIAEKHNKENFFSPELKNKIISNKLKESNIDFGAWGWVSKASKIIGITPQKTSAWIARNCPEVLNMDR
jgi:hypothetical protein